MKGDSKGKVLVVDDEPSLAEVIRDELNDAGFEALTTTSGLEALQALEVDPSIDVVLSDVKMPGMNGIELLERIRSEHKKNIVVILMTGFAAVSFEQLYDKGAQAIFPKPLNFDALIETIDRLLKCSKPEQGHRAPRIETTQTVLLKFESLDHARKEHLFNIARGGAFVALAGELPRVGSQLHIQILFEHGPLTSVNARACVRWVRVQDEKEGPRGMGIEFVEIEPKDRNNFLGFINTLQTKAYIPIS